LVYRADDFLARICFIVRMIDFSKFTFHPVVKLPAKYEVFDFTKGYDAARTRASEFGVGKYNEKRVGMYEHELFEGERNIHLGIDIAAPVGTPVHAFADGEIFRFNFNSTPGDYGYTIITKHLLDGVPLFALFGHLSAESLRKKHPGQKFRQGETIGWIGNEKDNGGWNPHVHIQLSYQEPQVCDMPGVVSEENLEAALKTYPDPQLVLGPLY
jgi:peptidoglycan LD-endopeptidase LytH